MSLQAKLRFCVGLQHRSKTVVHGEPRVDNILFQDTSHGVEAWLIDWQNVFYGSPMFDVAYFLSGSLSVPDRRSCELELIAHHNSLISQVDPTYTFEQAQEDYISCIPFGLLFTVAAINAIPQTDHTDSLLLTLLERNVAVIRDWK